MSADRDAYILLIYEDGANRLIQVSPNHHSEDTYYRAGRLIEIPTSADAFEFMVTGPAFGLERIWAFAASRPFQRIDGVEMSNGLIVLERDLPSVIRQLRAEGHARGIAYGEAQATVTTVPN